MGSVRFDCSSIDQALLSNTKVVTSNHMGSIYTTFLTLHNYDKAISPVNVGGVRWPGGMVAEAQYEKYCLTFPDIFINDFRTDRGLSDMVAYAKSSGLSFSMVLPTLRYMTDVSRGVADVENFVKRLVAGDFGALPDDFTLEIGNETSHIGWKSGTFTPGVGSYGYIANEFLTAINNVLSSEFFNPNGIAVKVAVQMSTTVGGQNSIFSQISSANLKTVDGFVRHSGLVLNADDFNVQFENAKVAALSNWWNRAWDGKAPDLKILDTAWAVGPSDPIVPGSAAARATFDIGTRHAAAVVETFSKLIAAGSDSAYIWGVQNNPSSMFYHEGEKITYGGHAFRLMAESLVGTTLVAGKLDAAGNWVDSGANWDSMVYADAAKAVIFVTAGTIGSDGLTVSIDLQGLGAIQYAWAEVISSALPVNSQQVVLNPTQLSESPVISRMVVNTNGTNILVSLTHDFEVIRIIVARENPKVGFLHLWGTSAHDDLEGGDSADLLEGGAGNDRLRGGRGSDTMLGGAGNDTYIIDDPGDRVFETTMENGTLDAGGIDTVKSSVSFSLDGSTGVRFIERLAITGQAHVNGNGNALDNRLTGNAGNNVLIGAEGNDVLSGWAGNDHLYGGTGHDALYGDAGHDTLDGGEGNDTLLGGSGDDVYLVDAIGDRVYEAKSTTTGQDAGGVDTVRSSVSFNLDADVGVRFVENLVLSGKADTAAFGNSLANQITGNAGNNVLNGGAENDLLSGWGGNDQLVGGTGNDTMYGGSGDDTLFGQQGSDLAFGGSGDDYYIVNALSDQVFETTTSNGGVDAGGTDTVQSSVSFNLDSHAGVRFVENLLFTGADSISGFGNDLANQLTGNAGNNLLAGGKGDDRLNGGGGNDLLIGGDGRDTFVFGTAVGAGNVDNISDFDNVEDTVHLDAAIFNGLAKGVLSAEAFSANAVGGATTDTSRIIYDADTGRLYYDREGLGATDPVLFATVSAGISLSFTDFFLF